MEHPDLAQLAGVVAAAGVILMLAGRGRLMVLGGLGLLGAAEAGLLASRSDTASFDRLASASGAVLVVFGLLVMAAAAAVLVRRPGWLPVVMILAAPLRPPIAFESGGGFPLSIATGGQLGRLLPLYFVLAVAAVALVWRAFDPAQSAGAVRALPRVVALPAAAFAAFSCLSVVWADQLGPAVELLSYFTIPFVVLLAVLARSPFPDTAPRAMAIAAIALGTVFAAIGLYQAATRELFFYAPNLAVSNANSDFFRVTSLFGDPSLYGRHLVLAMTVLLVCLALIRIDLRLGIGLLVVLWLGLFFSYSQSSMVALVCVTLAIAFATGGPPVRRVVAGGLALVLVLGLGFLASIEIRGDSLRRETSDRSTRITETTRVVEDAPLIGVGTGGQAQASRRLSGKEKPTPNFVSHFTPLTVAAELGVVGLALYGWLLVGGARAILAVGRLDRGLGIALGAALLALFTHSLFYPGFLEDPLTWVVLAVAAGQLTWSRRDDGVHRAARDAAPASA
ncbi:MAG TPA: O-antigen ligase family protein [Thermoleophilaceae bacterium]|nr:O-antigen ligase family protein [Thermoleophilaceae bacterium]